MFLHLISRKTAKANGLKKYFTGKFCAQGMIAERSVTTMLCYCEKHRKMKSDSDRRHHAKKLDKIAQLNNYYQHDNQPHLHFISREIAKSIGMKRFFDGRPCRHGYVDQKLVSNRSCGCKECKKDNIARSRAYREKNREKTLESLKDYHRRNRNYILEKQRNWKLKNKEKLKAYQQEKQAERNIREAKRRATKYNSTPPWYGELDDFVFEEARNLCELRNLSLGFNWNVDHMIPLQASNVVGLHVWNNFQVIPAIMNSSKNNRLIYINPFDWLHDIPKFFKVLRAA